MSENLGKNIESILKLNYVVPLYQRNFAWREDEIIQLLQDIFETYCRNPEQNYYIGSLVVLKRHDGRFEVIDGQQRLTTLSLIAKIFGRDGLPVLSYDSRPGVEKFFEIFYSHPEKIDDLTAPEVFYLKEAIRIIREANIVYNDTKLDLSQGEFKTYFLQKVYLVFVELPEDTDVALYFEIMNNRGEQLKAHEVVKAMMMAKITDKGQRHEFAKIWDACSQMDIPIQRLFSAEDRKKYFGDTYDGFSFKTWIAQGTNSNGETNKYPSLSDILLMADAGQIHEADASQYGENGIPETDDYTYNSIIDFPNFLMHVLRLYLKTQKVDVPLNEKELLSEYKKHQDDIVPIDFVEILFFCRTAFDRFIIKTVADVDDLEDGRKWVLLKPKRYTDSWKLVPSFDDKNQEKQIIKALSVLQVTFRSRVYKTWLYDVLKQLYEQYYQTKNLIFDSEQYLMFLHQWMLKYYDEQHFSIPKISEGEIPSRENSYSQGTNTSHFLLNFIDYLYYCRDAVSDFEFKYWNSVEHHLAQHKAVGKAEQYVDCLGNLYLISRSANSRLSDRDVKEKVTFYRDKKMGPNRQLIYAETEKANYEWGGKQIAKHYNDIVDLLNDRIRILGLVDVDIK